MTVEVYTADQWMKALSICKWIDDLDNLSVNTSNQLNSQENLSDLFFISSNDLSSLGCPWPVIRKFLFAQNVLFDSYSLSFTVGKTNDLDPRGNNSSIRLSNLQVWYRIAATALANHSDEIVNVMYHKLVKYFNPLSTIRFHANFDENRPLQNAKQIISDDTDAFEILLSILHKCVVYYNKKSTSQKSTWQRNEGLQMLKIRRILAPVFRVCSFEFCILFFQKLGLTENTIVGLRKKIGVKQLKSDNMYNDNYLMPIDICIKYISSKQHAFSDVESADSKLVQQIKSLRTNEIHALPFVTNGKRKYSADEREQQLSDNRVSDDIINWFFGSIINTADSLNFDHCVAKLKQMCHLLGINDFSDLSFVTDRDLRTVRKQFPFVSSRLFKLWKTCVNFPIQWKAAADVDFSLESWLTEARLGLNCILFSIKLWNVFFRATFNLHLFC